MLLTIRRCGNVFSRPNLSNVVTCTLLDVVSRMRTSVNKVPCDIGICIKPSGGGGMITRKRCWTMELKPNQFLFINSFCVPEIIGKLRFIKSLDDKG